MTAVPFEDDYRELIESARDAVRELLDESEHDAWASVRIAYGQLRGELARDDKRRIPAGGIERTPEQEESWRKHEAERAEAADSWRRLSPAARESLLLHVLGEERLILRELTSRLNAGLGYPSGKPCAVYQGHVRSLVMRMFGAGQLERDAEQFNGSHARYRYFRKRGLEGPIADLERTYQEGGE